MDIANQSQLILRNAGYETMPWTGGSVPVVCFENQSVLGFLYIFPTASAMFENWRAVQEVVLRRFSPAIKLSGQKAWNVYSVFVTEDSAPNTWTAERIEEDFTLTRKIAHAGVTSLDELRQALLPLLPVASRPQVEQTNFAEILRERLSEISPAAVNAFLGAAQPKDVADILEESR
jgi:hypothetical protein